MEFEAQNNHKISIKKYVFLFHTGHNGKHQLKSQLGFLLQIHPSSYIQYVQSSYLHFTSCFKNSVEFVD
jgi:hypothetical protein